MTYASLSRRVAPLACLLLVATTASAAVLTGSGTDLPIPSPNPAWPVGIAPTYMTVGTIHTGDWAPGSVHPNWAGTFGMSSPPIPALSTGTLRYDFTTLPLGYLPAGTFFYFGDVDGGSTNPERFNLEAYDAGAAIIPNEWLDDTYAVTGTGTGPGGTIVPSNMPSWDWNVTNPNSYQIAASGLPPTGNPNVGAVLRTNQPIWSMTLNKPTTHYGFNLLAPPPVPEPATALLALSGVVAGGVRRRV